MLIAADVATYLVLQLAAPCWWGRWRDALLATFYLKAGSCWVWQALAWPPAVFSHMYGSGAQLLAVPVSFLLTPLHPRAGVAGCAVMSVLGYTTLLLCHTGHSTRSSNGANALLRRTIQAGSGWVVGGAIAYSLINMAVMLLVCCTWEVVVRRAWLRREQQTHQDQEHHQQQVVSCQPPASLAGLGRGPSRPYP